MMSFIFIFMFTITALLSIYGWANLELTWAEKYGQRNWRLFLLSLITGISVIGTIIIIITNQFKIW